MMSWPMKLSLFVLLLAAYAGPAVADGTPRLWGTSYAVAAAPGDVVLGRQWGPVRVSTRLPRHLLCARVEAVSHSAVPQAVMLRDPLAAAPVTVVVVPAPCRGDWRDRWANFVVPGPTGSDILDVSLVSPDGQKLMRERIAVETSTGGGRRR